MTGAAHPAAPVMRDPGLDDWLEQAALAVGTPAYVYFTDPVITRIAALQAGAEAVLDLPLDENSLFARIRGLMRDRQIHAAPARGPGLAEDQQAFLPAKPAAPPTALVIAAVALKEGVEAWRGDACCTPASALIAGDQNEKDGDGCGADCACCAH